MMIPTSSFLTHRMKIAALGCVVACLMMAGPAQAQEGADTPAPTAKEAPAVEAPPATEAPAKTVIKEIPNPVQYCRMVLLGDSIVFEMADKLPDLLPMNGYNFSVVNAGLPGGGLLEKSILPDMPEKILSGDYVMISIGANDVLTHEKEIKDGDYKQHLTALVKYVIARGGKPLLLTYDAGPNDFFTKKQIKTILDKLNPMIEDVADDFDITALSTDGVERRDGVHLSEFGMRIVMHRLLFNYDYLFDDNCKSR